MPEGLPGDQPQASASPGYGEVVPESAPGNIRPSHSAGRHLPPSGQPSRFTRSRKIAITIALAIAASEVGVGLIFTKPDARPPLASHARLHPPPPKSSPSPQPSRSASHPGLVPRGLISFEDGTDGWKPLFGSLRSSQTTQVAYRGSHSLLLTVRGTYSAVGVENGVAGLRPGDKVTFHIYSDGQQGGSVLPFAERWNQPEDLADKIPLPAHPGWFSLTWVVPSVSQVERDRHPGRPSRQRPAHPGHRRPDLARLLTTRGRAGRGRDPTPTMARVRPLSASSAG